jgi:hypothetical protein
VGTASGFGASGDDSNTGIGIGNCYCIFVGIWGIGFSTSGKITFGIDSFLKFSLVSEIFCTFKIGRLLEKEFLYTPSLTNLVYLKLGLLIIWVFSSVDILGIIILLYCVG